MYHVPTLNQNRAQAVMRFETRVPYGCPTRVQPHLIGRTFYQSVFYHGTEGICLGVPEYMHHYQPDISRRWADQVSIKFQSYSSVITSEWDGANFEFLIDKAWITYQVIMED